MSPLKFDLYQNRSEVFSISISHSAFAITLIERSRNDFRTDKAPTDINLNVPVHYCRLDWHVCESNILFEIWGGTPGCNLAGCFSVNVYIVTISCDTSFDHFKADELSGETLFLLSHKCIST